MLKIILSSLTIGASVSIAHAMPLAQVFDAAVRRNEGVAQSEERYRQADERVSQATGAILPTVSVSGIYQIQPPAKDPLAAEFFPEKQTTTQATLNQPLFRSFREFAGRRQQQDLRSAAAEAKRQVLMRLYEDVAMNYLNILSLEHDLKNLGDQEEVYGRRIGELRGRARTGESSTNEVLSAQSTHASLLAEIQLVKGQLQTARDSFASTTGLPRETVLDETLLNASLKVDKLDNFMARLEQRPDIREAQERVNAAGEDVTMAKGAHGPTADLVANYYFQRPGPAKDMNWDVQFRVNLPIYEGGVTQSRVRESASRRGEAELELARLRRTAADQIRSLHENLRARAGQIDALEKAAELSEKNTQVLQRDYRRGLARNIDVQMGLTEWRVARRTLDQARSAAQLELIRLKIASADFPFEKDKP